MLRTSSAVRVLGAADRDAALAVCARDPVANAFVASRLLEDRAFALSAARCGATSSAASWSRCAGPAPTWCRCRPRPLPWTASRRGPGGPGGAAPRSSARPTAVLGLWDRLERPWWPAREVRADQPLLALDGDPLVAAGPAGPAGPAGRDRPGRAGVGGDVPGGDRLLADRAGRRCVVPAVGGPAGRCRPDLRADGPGRCRRRSFKADLASVTPQVAQIQGVWVAPAPARPGTGRPGDGRGLRDRPGARSRRSSRSTSTPTTPRRSRRTGGWASGRSAPSPPSCSDRGFHVTQRDCGPELAAT